MKRFLLVIGMMIACLCLMSTQLTAQPEAVIVIEAWSPQELHDLGLTSHPSTGLSTVGVGETVYLFAREAGGEEVTMVTWSLTTQPTGSTIVLDSTDTQRTTFHPDIEGQYVVDVTIMTASGSANSSVTITAARYVGVGTVGGASPDFAKGQCASCHPGTAGDWMATGHATMFELAIDGLKSSHYNESCIECHTVGFFEGADNDGFADRANDLGWTFPDSLVPGNWQSMIDNFPELVEVANIQCENCHGPGTQHTANGVNKDAIDISLDEGVCGRCHEEAPYHVKNTQWKNSGHGLGGTWDSQGLRAIEPTDDFRSECANCHSPIGFIERVDPASNLVDKVGLTGEPLSCAGCHDPHDIGAGEHQLRLPVAIQLASGPTLEFGGKGQLCMNCHQDRRAGGGEVYAASPRSTFRGPHHSNHADMLAGVPEAVITFGMILPNSTHKDVVKNTCVDCHMAPNDRDDLGDHSWAMNTTEVVNGVETTYDNVTSCQGCHDPDMTSFDDLKARADHDGDGTIEAAQAEIHGLLDDIAMMLPPVGEPTVDIRDPLWNQEESLLQRKVMWNWAWVEYDHSFGVHNYQFSVALLQNSKAALMYGVLSEGVITGVEDIPNDQGKQVRVTWTRFGGDGISDNPVRNYAIWRKVEDTASASKEGALETLNISSEQVANLDGNSKLSINGELWDFVGSVPAATMEEYSAVVPTLYDSTGADGVRLSTFVVSGHTDITAIYAVTDEATGYSIDNLAPVAPMNAMVEETDSGAALAWDEPLDEDFKYFAVYRSSTQGFDPTATEPIAELTENSYTDGDVIIGSTYYYRLAAFDFSGNQSEFSDELTLVVTSVINSDGQIPEDYSLAQNYPNPFNPTTTIRFGLKEAGEVELVIYNAIGEKVQTVIKDFMSAGTHSVTIGAADLTSGVYFYRITASKFNSVKKMVLIK